MATIKPNLTRTWASGAPSGNVIDPDTTTPGKFAAGWLAEVPPFEHFNFLQQLFTQGLAHNNEQGINKWDIDTVYPTNGLAKGSNGEIYISVSNQSGNDPVTDDGTNWVPLLSRSIKNLKYVTDIINTDLTGINIIVCQYRDNNEQYGGGGIFIKTSTGSADNGITFADINGFLFTRQDVEKVDIRWFGAVNDITFDSSSAIQAAIDVVKSSKTRVRSGLALTHPIFDKEKSLYIPDGFYMHATSLWFGVDVDAEDLLPTPDYSKVVNKITGTGMLFATCTGKVAWDFTGVFGLHISGPITFWGDFSNQPRVGMLFARSGTGGTPHNPSAGNHFGSDFRILGSFDLCNMYNYGSEINHWTNVDLLNFTGKAVVINTANNARYVVVSEYATVDTTIQSAYSDTFTNCSANLARTAAVTGDEAVFIVESVAYGPKCIGGYMDASSSVYTPYFRFVDALGVTGTAAITQSPTIMGVTFESEAVPIVEISGTVTNLNINGSSLSTSSGTPHIVVTPSGTLTQYDIQAYSGDTLNLPVAYDIQAGGSATRGQLDIVPVDDLFLTNYQLNIGDLTLDGTYYDIDIATIAGIPAGAKFVHVKTRVRSAAASDATTLILRGDATTSVPESFISLPNGTASSQYFEGRVPVINNKIQYAASVDLTVASIIIKAYEV